MKFDPFNQPYASNRNVVVAKNGMVTTSSSLASSAGLQILQKGGNAVDAAIATAAALTVVEPTSNGIGGDCFAIVWMKNQLYGMNASGKSPELLTMDAVKQKHGKPLTMPVFGWTPITVPGVPKGWASLNQKFGNLSLKECLEPAIQFASQGYPMGMDLERMWDVAAKRYLEESKDSQEFDEWKKTFLIDGKAPTFGQIIKLPNHAKTLAKIAETNAEDFYSGSLADEIESASIKHGGFIRKKDLENFEVEWVDPVSINYRGYDVYEIPPNGQGIISLMALSILKNKEFIEKESLDTVHTQIEAMKMAFTDGLAHISDPKDMSVSVSDLISDAYGQKRYQEITDCAMTPTSIEPPKGGTVYLATADQWGNMVSFIQSNYRGFGSGVVVKNTGIALQNRGCEFSLDQHHVNALKPMKKTYHTIIPGFLMKEGKAIGPFGVMGGYMQPQGHVQVAMNLIDFHLNPQMALDAPRWQWVKGKQVLVEQKFPAHLIEGLTRLGHQVTVNHHVNAFGRGQVIVRLANGTLVGGCESRTDSNIASY